MKNRKVMYRMRVGRTGGMGEIEKYYMYKAALNLLYTHELTHEFIRFVISLMNPKARMSLRKWINRPIGKTGDKRDILQEDVDDREMATNMIKGLVGHKFWRNTSEVRQYLIDRFERETVRKSSSPKAFAKLMNLREIFGLSDEETDILGLLYSYLQFGPFEDLCDKYKLPKLIKIMATAIDAPVQRVKSLLSLRGRLVRTSIIEGINPASNSQTFTLNDEIIWYLSGLDDLPFSQKYCKEYKGSTHDLPSFRVQEKSISMISQLIRGDDPCHILLYGQAGAGKTEFAKSLVAGAGKSVFFTQYGEEDTQITRSRGCDRKIALQASIACTPKENAVLVVDEADALLNTGYFMFGSDKSPEKGWLNSFLDETKHQIIWITNNTHFMEESTLRRFAYSIKFKKFTKRDREEVWRQLLKKHPMRRFISERMVREISTKYQVNAAGIASALETLKRVMPRRGADREKVKLMLSELLERHQEATGHECKTGLNMLTDRYDVSALNIDTDRESFIRSTSTFGEQRNRAGSAGEGNINVLFWGQPGTGKTEFAKYIADRSGMDLLVKRSSDLQSC